MSSSNHKPILLRINYTVKLFMKVLAFTAAALVYFLIMGSKVPALLSITRTSAIVLLSFVITYLFMTNVYGGFDIGVRKSKPIILSMAMTLLFSDLAANVFLSIMATTGIHGGKLVFERPLRLLVIYLVQLVLIALLTELANDFYFRIHKAAKCLVVTKEGADISNFLRSVRAYKKQYQITDIVDIGRDDLKSLIEANDSVFFCELTPAERSEAVLYCYRKKKDIYYSVELADIVSLRGKLANFDDKSFIASPETYMTFEQRCIKRGIDLLASALVLIITAPIFLVTAAAIRMEDGGPVFYRQKRATFGGRTFEVLKFRSMRVQDGSIHKSVTKDDDRITKVGRVIRKYRIDELPQLINILRSDMSLVGPRPEMLENVEQYTAELPEFVYRLRAKAGLTGMAQIYGRYNTSPKDKLMLDLAYIEQYSIWLDLKLLFRTVLVLFTPDESTEAFDNKKEDKA